jgi:hypothetical protein
MLIKKNYDVKSLVEALDGALSVALDDREITVEIGLLEASEIKEILDYVARVDERQIKTQIKTIDIGDGVREGAE